MVTAYTEVDSCFEVLAEGVFSDSVDCVVCSAFVLEAPELLAASLSAALYMLWVPTTTTPDTMQITSAAMASPLPLRVFRTQAARPIAAKMRPSSARKNDRLLIMGINEVS